jgi:hypothetical protein
MRRLHSTGFMTSMIEAMIDDWYGHRDLNNIKVLGSRQTDGWVA